jgi:hypothetical protein
MPNAAASTVPGEDNPVIRFDEANLFENPGQDSDVMPPNTSISTALTGHIRTANHRLNGIASFKRSRQHSRHKKR